MSKYNLALMSILLVITNTSEISAMESIEKESIFLNTKKVKIKELGIEDKKDDRENTIHKLLLEFDSVSKEDTSNLEYIKNSYNTGYNFGDQESNYSSLYNWIVYTRSLYALEHLGQDEEGITLKKECQRAKRRLETIDFYTDGKDYKYCLSGIWCIVSTFDTKERENFLRALKEGKEIPKDQRLINFFKSFQ